MKKKKQYSRRRPANPLGVLAKVMLFLLAIFALSILWQPGKNANKQDDNEKIILGKLSSKQLKSKFTPVLIYRSLDGKNAAFAGSGSLFVGSQGEQIITSEHLFSKSFGTQIFAYRKIRPFEEIVTHAVEKVLYSGQGIDGSNQQAADAIILKTGNAKPIVCFSSHEHVENRHTAGITPFKKTIEVTSLLTGEKVRVIGRANDSGDTGVNYALLDYPSIEGESGEGFVDENDNLYVLKGVPMDISPEQRAMLQNALGNPRAISIAYGPLQLRN